MPLNPYRIMWVIVMFDLPIVEQKHRRAYTQFRNLLLRNGFNQLQYSVYARVCGSRESMETHKMRIRRYLPKEGSVSLLHLTDKQFAAMETFYGRVEAAQNPGYQQLELF